MKNYFTLVSFSFLLITFLAPIELNAQYETGITILSNDNCCVTYSLRLGGSGNAWTFNPDTPNPATVYTGTTPTNDVVITHCFEESGTYKASLRNAGGYVAFNVNVTCKCEDGFFLQMCPVYNCDPCEDGWAFVCAMGTYPDGTTAELNTIDSEYIINWINPSSNGQCASGFGPVSGNTTLEAEIIDLVGCSHIVTLDVSCPLLRTNSESELDSKNPPAEKISITPNPAKDFITISNPESVNLNIKIFNLNGQLLKEKNIYQAPTTTIDTDDLPKGIYILQTKNLDSEESPNSEKLVIEK